MAPPGDQAQGRCRSTNLFMSPQEEFSPRAADMTAAARPEDLFPPNPGVRSNLQQYPVNVGLGADGNRFAFAKHAFDKVAASKNSMVSGNPFSRILPEQRLASTGTPQEPTTPQFLPRSLGKTCCHEVSVALNGRLSPFGKPAQHRFYVLNSIPTLSGENRMPGIWVLFQILHAVNQSGTHWIEVDVANQFQKVRLFFHHDAFVSVLE
jgi:hypothetical protein